MPARDAPQPFIKRLPKVELHLHLEGAVRPETLRELSRNKVWLRKKVGEWISKRRKQHFRYGSFREFLLAFGVVSLLLEEPKDYALATTRLVEWLGEQKVRYAEITLAAGVLLWKRQSVEAVFEAVAAAAAEAQQRTGVRVQWIFDAVRHFGLEHVREVLRWAARLRLRGVVALGLGGDEERGPAELFRDVFREARDHGLHIVAHAGEACGPESVRGAVELLGAERIGHGLSAARDPALLALLRDRQVPLEVCLTSNVATGVVARLEDHPLPKFLEAGLVVTLNSDDPAMFRTSLEEEFARAAKTFGLSSATLAELARNAANWAFLPEGERRRLLAEINGVAAG
jgi:adenosine deaminase/aminodeoxyfutalosine deaminase